MKARPLIATKLALAMPRLHGARNDLARATIAFLVLYGAVGVPLIWRNEAVSDLLPASLVLGATLAALSAIDLKFYRLPDVLTLPLAAMGLLVSSWSGAASFWWSGTSAGLGFVLLASIAWTYRYVRKRPGLGLGDAKLLAASGAWLGAQALPTVLLAATGAALVYVLVAVSRGASVSGASRIAFGPFLSLATWLVWLYGPL